MTDFGRMPGGRPPKLSELQVHWAKWAWKRGVKVEEMLAELAVSRCSLYRYAGLYDFGPHPLGNRAKQAQRLGLDALVEDGLMREERPICFVCHGASKTWDGHPQCRGKRAA